MGLQQKQRRVMIDAGQVFDLRSILVAVFSSSAISALVTAAAGWHLSQATAGKVEAETQRLQHAENSEVERVVNERIKMVFEASEGHIKFLTEEIGRLRKQVEMLSSELHQARVEISQLRESQSHPVHVPPSDVAQILNQDF